MRTKLTKTLAPVAAALLVSMASCTSKEKLEKAEAQNETLNTELQATLATQDSLFALINDISAGMSQIKDIEHIIATPGELEGETASRKNQLRNDMVAIREALQQRRERLADLETQLKKSNGNNANMLKTVQNLKAQIADQETQIATLNNQLSAANAQIAKLGQTVDTLNTQLTTVTGEREQAREQAVQLDNELNACFFAIGNKKQLKDNRIIETGFLRKTKILPSDFERSYFTQGDKRSLRSIPLHSNKAKVLTNQPADSYEIVDSDGQKVLNIKNPSLFWSLSNFLVIQID